MQRLRFVFYHFFQFLQDLQVELKEEAESQRATELHFSSRSREWEDQLVQEDVVGLAEGLIVPGPGGHTQVFTLLWPLLKIKLLSG